MLILKMMSDEDLPDDDTRKSFDLQCGVRRVRFDRDPAPNAWVLFDEETQEYQFPLVGNVYVMNESGKTVSSFGVAPVGHLAEFEDDDGPVKTSEPDRLKRAEYGSSKP